MGTVTDGAAAVEADGPLQRVMGFSFIESDGNAPAQVWILQPFQGEQRPFDSADLAQGYK
ncbi:MAG TPA: hypothetical protein VK638_42925 [Edaphobacter sp.]|nr:hypothetical protein [Edaphobacter sp.]